MAKFDKQSLPKQIFFGMRLLHAQAHYICIVCAKYRRASVKALVQVDFLTYALSKHKHKPYLIGKNGLVHKATILSKINILASNFFTQMFNVSILSKQSIRLFQHMHYLVIIHKQNALRITKGNNTNKIGP